MRILEQYQSVDGVIFDELEDCLQHELNNAVEMNGISCFDYAKSLQPMNRSPWIVYLLHNKDECAYVGRSQRLHCRLLEHRHKSQPIKFNEDDLVLFIQCSNQEEAQATEKAMIRWIKPSRNKY